MKKKLEKFLLGNILTLAAHEGLGVPEDLAVLGVDNYEPICENTTPSLSSIEPDFLRCGELAALLLAAYMRDGKHFRGSRRRTFGPARTVVRASTRTTVVGTDRTVAKALETIRTENRFFGTWSRTTEIVSYDAAGQEISTDRSEQSLADENCYTLTTVDAA